MGVGWGLSVKEEIGHCMLITSVQIVIDCPISFPFAFTLVKPPSIPSPTEPAWSMYHVQRQLVLGTQLGAASPHRLGTLAEQRRCAAAVPQRVPACHGSLSSLRDSELSAAVLLAIKMCN